MIRPALLLIALMGSFISRAQHSRQPENLVFEGAGIRGIAYCGALLELEERDMLDDVRRVAGTSSGAITASLLSVGYRPSEIYEIIGSTDFARFNDGGGYFIGGMVRMNKQLGWYKGDAFLKWLRQLVYARTGNADITFRELAQLAASDQRFRELVVTACSLNHQTSLFFSASTFPEMKIVDAVRASMAVPLYFEPIIIDDHGAVVKKEHMRPEHHLLVDGGFTTNFPISVFDAPGYDAPTLGFRIDSVEQIQKDGENTELAYVPVEDVDDFVKAFYILVKETMNRTSLDECDWERTAAISDCGIGPKVKRMSEEEKALLIEAGRQAARTWLDKPAS